MGVYSSIKEAASTVEVDAIECQQDNMLEAAMGIVAESEYNFGLIMKGIGSTELAVYESTGVEMVYESEAVSGFFGKLKEFFMNILAKIKGLFKRFMALFDSYTKSDKDFVAKYKKDLYAITHSLKDFKFKGYEFEGGNYDIAAVDGKVAGSMHGDLGVASLDAIATTTNLSEKNEKDDEIVGKMRGAAVGQGELTASEFTKELFSHFRKGENEKQELDNPDLNKIVTTLEGSSKRKTQLEKAMRDLEKIINDEIKAIDKKQKEMTKEMPNTEKSTMLNAVVTFSKFNRQRLAIVQVYNGAMLNAVKDENRQCKSVCVSLLHYKPKSESAAWQHNVSESGFLAGVNFK